MPGPSPRDAQRGGPSGRRAGAQRPRRTRRPPKREHARRIGWSRRIGIAAALLLVCGGSLVFASQALEGSKASAPPPTAPPPPPPILLAPAVTLTRSSLVDVAGLAPTGLRRDQRYELRVYVNDQRVRQLELPSDAQFTLSDVPIEEGANTIRVTLVGGGGEGNPSAAVGVTRDDIVPEITISQPRPAEKIYTPTATLAGRTEPGADMQITDSAGHVIDSSIDSAGRFSAGLTLAIGSNELVLRSTDPAGNRAVQHVTIQRASSDATLLLTVTPTEIFGAQLPARVELTAIVRDEEGQPVDGQEVVFSVSPPDRETVTYRVTTSNGRARFSDLVIDRSDAQGAWLVTAMAVLPSGIELRGDGAFSLQAGDAPRSPGRH